MRRKTRNKPPSMFSKGECVKLLKVQGVPRNIFLHSRKVNAVAVFLAKLFERCGEDMDTAAVDAASFLHDIHKHKEIEGKVKLHTKSGGKLLEELGYPKIGKLMRKHGLDQVTNKNDPLSTWEEKLVYYADKRVTQDSIVSLGERFSYLEQKYGEKSQEVLRKIVSLRKPAMNLERQIFKKLGAKPEEITERSIKPYLASGEYS